MDCRRIARKTLAWGRLTGRRLTLICAGFMASFLGASRSEASCLSLTSGPVIFDVGACKQINPAQDFNLADSKYKWVRELDPAGRKDFFHKYSGLFLKGKVVKSDAVQVGLNQETGALEGETIFLYIPPSVNQCKEVMGTRLQGNLKEVCCDGGGKVPCLLGTGYLFHGVKVMGKASSGAGDDARQKALKSKTYRAGIKAFSKREYKKAVGFLERAKVNGELDIKGHYFLGLAYRELDLCPKAIRPLKYVYENHGDGKVWADEDRVARKATFLLARCYSKMNEPGRAVLILNSYLLEPQKYRWELKESLSHKDFGWIHTSADFREYQKEANKALRKQR